MNLFNRHHWHCPNPGSNHTSPTATRSSASTNPNQTLLRSRRESPKVQCLVHSSSSSTCYPLVTSSATMDYTVMPMTCSSTSPPNPSCCHLLHPYKLPHKNKIMDTNKPSQAQQWQIWNLHHRSKILHQILSKLPLHQWFSCSSIHKNLQTRRYQTNSFEHRISHYTESAFFNLNNIASSHPPSFSASEMLIHSLQHQDHITLSPPEPVEAQEDWASLTATQCKFSSSPTKLLIILPPPTLSYSHTKPQTHRRQPP